jgi:hypothetical protein
MRTGVRLILLCVSLSVAASAAVAQPRRRSQPAAPALDARCEDARYRYEAVTSDKAHRTVEEQEWVQYSEARKYLRLCWDEGDYLTQTLKKYVYFYEADARAGRADAPAYARMAEAIVEAEYEPRKRELAALVESGKSPESKEAREAWARVASSLDAVVDAYARALASCAPGEGCQVAKDYWAGNLTTYYMLRHDGSQEGLAQTLAGALARPLPSH